MRRKKEKSQSWVIPSNPSPLKQVKNYFSKGESVGRPMGTRGVEESGGKKKRMEKAS